MVSLKSYRMLAYLGLIPFLVFTYTSWCGPLEEIRESTRAFMVFSASTLIFISGCWWGISFSKGAETKRYLMLVGLVFGLGTALAGVFLSPFWLIVTLGLGHFLIWIMEFIVPGLDLQHDYKVQRTILTMTIVVCHALVITHFFA